MDYATFGLNLRGISSEAVARSTLDVSTYSSLLSKLALLHRPLDPSYHHRRHCRKRHRNSSLSDPGEVVVVCHAREIRQRLQLRVSLGHHQARKVGYSDTGDEELEAEELDVPVGPDVAVETECEATDSAEIGHWVTRCALEHGSAAGMVIHLSLSPHTNALCSRVALESCEDLGHDLPGRGVAADGAVRPSETACLISHPQFCSFLTPLCGVLMVKVVCSHLALSAGPEVG